MEEQEKVKDFVKSYDLEAKPEFRALDIVSEIGEVAKELLKASKYGKSECSYSEGIKRELGDLLFSVICLANTYEIDLSEALDLVLEGYKKRIGKYGSPGSSNI